MNNLENISRYVVRKPKLRKILGWDKYKYSKGSRRVSYKASSFCLQTSLSLIVYNNFT